MQVKYTSTRILLVTSSLKISHWCVFLTDKMSIFRTHPNRQFPSILTSSQAFHRASPIHNKWQTGRCNTLPPCLLFCLIRPPLGTTSHRYILTSVLWYQTLLYKNTPENDQINSPKKTNHKNQCHKHCQKNQQLCETNCSSQKTTPKLEGLWPMQAIIYPFIFMKDDN